MRLMIVLALLVLLMDSCKKTTTTTATYCWTCTAYDSSFNQNKFANTSQSVTNLCGLTEDQANAYAAANSAKDTSLLNAIQHVEHIAVSCVQKP